jgi:hypothetical protein
MIKLRNVLSRKFDIREGVRQGDPLACLLFNISLENVIRDAEVETNIGLCRRYSYNWTIIS